MSGGKPRASTKDASQNFGADATAPPDGEKGGRAANAAPPEQSTSKPQENNPKFKKCTAWRFGPIERLNQSTWRVFINDKACELTFGELIAGPNVGYLAIFCQENFGTVPSVCWFEWMTFVDCSINIA